jgi:DNA primase
MEIAEIKSQLTIGQVLDHYNLSANKNKMLCCPFHNDKTPSMQVYPETNTVFCFSSNCKLHGKAIDVIDFILHQEGISKHEAINKAKELAGYKEPEQPFEKLFKVFQSTLKKNEKALSYLKERGIEKAETGFNSGTWENLKQCVIFPLRDKKEKIVSLYGRSIYNNTESKHFYTRNRKGLYPGYPKANTKQLILTEAIIDAATLLQITDYKILACYGTNGFTPEHEQAIKDLKQ